MFRNTPPPLDTDEQIAKALAAHRQPKTTTPETTYDVSEPVEPGRPFRADLFNRRIQARMILGVPDDFSGDPGNFIERAILDPHRNTTRTAVMRALGFSKGKNRDK